MCHITTEARINIFEVYTDAVKARACHQWFKMFQNSWLDIYDKSSSGRRPILNGGRFKKTIELDSRQSIIDLLQKHNISYNHKPIFCFKNIVF